MAVLKRMTVKQLQARHVGVFGEETPAHQEEYPVKRIAWRIEANAEGDLSDHARQRAMELANVNALAHAHQESLPVCGMLSHFLGHVGSATLGNQRTRMVRQLTRSRVSDNDRLLTAVVVVIDGSGHRGQRQNLHRLRQAHERRSRRSLVGRPVGSSFMRKHRVVVICAAAAIGWLVAVVNLCEAGTTGLTTLTSPEGFGFAYNCNAAGMSDSGQHVCCRRRTRQRVARMPGHFMVSCRAC